MPQWRYLVELGDGLFANLDSQLVFRRVGVGEPAVAQTVIADGKVRLLGHPGPDQPATMAEWQEHRDADQAAAAEADQERRERVRERRQPVDWCWLNATQEKMTLAEAITLLRDKR